ncbi:aldo/keto reductase, partial [Clostridium perfringens]|nr:aldo/keto reductase [Clostridium perfringens]
VNKERMKQNIDIFNFELSKDDMNTISALDKKESSFFNHQEASSVEMLASLNR